MLPHLKAEIKKADFDLNRLTVFLAGGPQAYKRHRIIVDAMLKEPAMMMRNDFQEIPRDEKFKEMMRLYHDFHTIVEPRLPFRFSLTDQFSVFEQWQQVNILSMNFHAFYQSIRLLATDQQCKQWLPQVEKFKMIGCYGQTELAHGSDVQSLQTTATYLKSEDSFIINTPHFKAAKFWPGQLGKLSNHSIVVANLIIEGKEYGQHMFMVPIRSLEDHSLLPGVEAGDIGTKHGNEVKDHGYAIFTKVKIPRTNMLMKFQTLDSNGNYSKQGNPKLLYLFLLRGRASIVNLSYINLMRAITITLRYLSYRKQFGNNPDGSERIVLDYQLVQSRIMPILANTYCLFFLLRRLRKEFIQMELEIKTKGESQNLAAMHSLLSGLKPMISTSALHDLEQCRQSCGGHGFLSSAGLTHVLKNHYWLVTVEGENRMIIQQTARYVLKSMQRLFQGKPVSPDFEYMQKIRDEEQQASMDLSKEVSLSQIKKLIELRAYHYIMKVSMKLNKLAKNKPIVEIWNEQLQPQLVQMALLHTETYFFNTVSEEMNKAIQNKELEPTLGKHILRMLKITGIRLLLRNLSPLYSSGVFKSKEQQFLVRDLNSEIAELRPQCIALVDCFGFDDQFFYSTIGKRSEDPYDAILKYARHDNPLNKLHTLPGFEEYMRPLMRMPKL